MHIKLHGGACCGIKHIHALGSDPHYQIVARKALDPTKTSFGRRGCTGVNDAHADTYPEDFFNEDAPKETYIDRFDRLLAFVKDNRPHGIVEVVLVSCQDAWFPLIEERGFKLVTKAKNSNTSAMLHVFHLGY